MNDNGIKKLFFDLWKIFPTGLSQNKVQETIIMADMREELVKHGFLYEEPCRSGEIEGKQHSLGANGINLILAWETQKQNYRFNLILIFLTGILNILTTVMLLRLFAP